MFNNFFSNFLGKSDAQDDQDSRRRYERRGTDRCVSVINGKTYPVENWSLGGLLVYGDPRPFGVENEIDVTLKFKMRNDIMDVPHKARVVRKSHDKIAFEFLPLTSQIRNRFQTVIDDYMAAEFADSQLT
jgi:hypothetical protein